MLGYTPCRMLLRPLRDVRNVRSTAEKVHSRRQLAEVSDVANEDIVRRVSRSNVDACRLLVRQSHQGVRSVEVNWLQRGYVAAVPPPGAAELAGGSSRQAIVRVVPRRPGRASFASSLGALWTIDKPAFMPLTNAGLLSNPTSAGASTAERRVMKEGDLLLGAKRAMHGWSIERYIARFGAAVVGEPASAAFHVVDRLADDESGLVLVQGLTASMPRRRDHLAVVDTSSPSPSAARVDTSSSPSPVVTIVRSSFEIIVWGHVDMHRCLDQPLHLLHFGSADHDDGGIRHEEEDPMASVDRSPPAVVHTVRHVRHGTYAGHPASVLSVDVAPRPMAPFGHRTPSTATAAERGHSPSVGLLESLRRAFGSACGPVGYHGDPRSSQLDVPRLMLRRFAVDVNLRPLLGDEGEEAVTTAKTDGGDAAGANIASLVIPRTFSGIVRDDSGVADGSPVRRVVGRVRLRDGG